MPPYFLYRLTFLNGKTYIGITNDFNKRLLSHIGAARNGSELPVHRALRKHGLSKTEILANGPRDYIAEMEIRAIARLNPEYNISPGGDISPMTVARTRAKVSASMVERFKDPAIREQNRIAQRIAQNRPEVQAARAARAKGRTASVETRAKMSAARTGRKQSAEHIANLVAARKGATRSDESRKRMSEGQKKRIRTPEEIERMRTLAKGRVVTPEHREKLRIAALARWARTRE